MEAEVPPHDAANRRARIGRARALLLDPTAGDLLERAVRLASRALRAPIAVFGVPEFGRLQVRGQIGLPEPWRGLGHLPLEGAFCSHVVATGGPFVVEDAARHPLAFAVPRLENFTRVAYCGVPLTVAGEVLAVLSVCDVESRRWTPEDVKALRDLASAVLRDIEGVMHRLDSIVPVGGALSLSQLPEAFVAVDVNWRFTQLTERAAELLKREPEDLVGRSFWEVFPGLIGTTFHQDVVQAASATSPVEREEYVDAVGRWLEVRAYPLGGGGAAIQLRDVTTRRSAQEDLRHSEARYRHLFEDSRTPLFVMSHHGVFTEVNRAFEEMVGRARGDIVGTQLAGICASPDMADRLLQGLAVDGTVIDMEIALRRADGLEIMCEVSGTSQQADDALVFHGVFRDITVQKLAEAELLRSALHDPLTGLANRLVFMDRLERLLKQAQRRPGYRFAVIFLDLDNFKHINDTYGHMIGDQLLVSVARRLEACLRQGDTVARMGGDEFAVLLDAVTDIASVTWVVDRIQDELSQPFPAAGGDAGTTASIGIAVSTGAYEKAEDLLRDADEAMYRAKSGGRNRYLIFDSGMHERALEQRQLEQDLRRAMEQQQLALHYQPVIDLSGGAVAGLEALLRWSHPERGVLLPDEFMPLAEQTGLIIDIGWWVLREACRQLRAWQLDYPDAAFRLTMSVNLSAKQFVHPQLLNKIDEILEETRLPARCLRLDLTEAVVMQNVHVAARLLQELRERGIQICLDDFGTGYSSIRQLREYPISSLKIDRSFIGRIGEEAESREIVQTIIALGNSMAIDAVAEGVETPEQLELLRRLGTRFAQGFLFSLPLDPGATSRLLSSAPRGGGRESSRSRGAPGPS